MPAPISTVGSPSAVKACASTSQRRAGARRRAPRRSPGRAARRPSVSIASHSAASATIAAREAESGSAGRIARTSRPAGCRSSAAGPGTISTRVQLPQFDPARQFVALSKTFVTNASSSIRPVEPGEQIDHGRGADLPGQRLGSQVANPAKCSRSRRPRAASGCAATTAPSPCRRFRPGRAPCRRRTPASCSARLPSP